jgi:hypothetical protein
VIEEAGQMPAVVCLGVLLSSAVPACRGFDAVLLGVYGSRAGNCRKYKEMSVNTVIGKQKHFGVQGLTSSANSIVGSIGTESSKLVRVT